MHNAAIHAYFALLSFLWGACIGSYANVCVHRIPMLGSTILPRSHCPGCRHLIAWYHNIPVISWFMLGAKCRHCLGRISARYVLVELLTAICFLLIWLSFGPTARTPVYWGLTTALIIGAFIDLDVMIIPDRITIGGMLAGLILSFLFPGIHGQALRFDGLLASITGLAIGVFWLWSVARLGTWFFKREAMGMGDVKLLGAIGAFLGWQAVVFTVLISSIAGAAVGLTLVVTGRKQMQSRIPYGPYLALAALIWILGGNNAWEIFLGLTTQSTDILHGAIL